MDQDWNPDLLTPKTMDAPGYSRKIMSLESDKTCLQLPLAVWICCVTWANFLTSLSYKIGFAYPHKSRLSEIIYVPSMLASFFSKVSMLSIHLDKMAHSQLKPTNTYIKRRGPIYQWIEFKRFH